MGPFFFYPICKVNHRDGKKPAPVPTTIKWQILDSHKGAKPSWAQRQKSAGHGKGWIGQARPARWPGQRDQSFCEQNSVATRW